MVVNEVERGFVGKEEWRRGERRGAIRSEVPDGPLGRWWWRDDLEVDFGEELGGYGENVFRRA